MRSKFIRRNEFNSKSPTTNIQVTEIYLSNSELQIQSILYVVHSHIKAMNRAFHPLGNSGQGPETVAHDVVQLSVSILKHVESLSKRLLGSYTQVREEEGAVSTSNTGPPKLSPSQLAAQEVTYCKFTPNMRISS